MRGKITNLIDTVKHFWLERTKKQKGILIGSVFAAIAIIASILFFTSNQKFVPLYNNLSMQESNQIKTELDSRKVPYELTDGGTTITVPEEEVDSLLVDLAGQGIPNSGNIDYSFFSENTSWGITDNEFNMLKLDAMQTELGNLIKSIEGIEDAKVMINMPKDPVFVSEASEPASASIVLTTQPGYQFQGNQMKALYTLVSKAVPNLPPENIAIMNQYFEYYDQYATNDANTTDDYTYQQTVKRDVERDVQRRLQQMLGTIVGMDNVIVSVTADIDFTKENRVEELVEPVDKENMEGLPVSIEKIQETYTGNPNEVGGVPGVGEEDIPNYQAQDEQENGDYELNKETINNEFNRIKKEIVESPYKIRDLGIQVAVNNVKNQTDDQVEYLSQQDQNMVEEGITSILDSVISTSINQEYEENEEIVSEDNISVVFQEFNRTPMETDQPSNKIPIWAYVIGGILLTAVIILIILLLRKRKEVEDFEIVEEDLPMQVGSEIEDINIDEESEAVIRRKQLEKMAKEKPDEFAKLLRSWIGED